MALLTLLNLTPANIALTNAVSATIISGGTSVLGRP